MLNPFIGQITMVGFPFAPKNHALCNGQIIPIQQNAALFSLLGTYYGGNGVQNFALPELRGRTPVNMSPSNPQGESGGTEAESLLMHHVPAHTHTVMATTAAGVSRSPKNALHGSGFAVYGPANSAVPLASQTVTPVGGSSPHNNMQPYLAIPFCIALTGRFPARN